MYLWKFKFLHHKYIAKIPTLFLSLKEVLYLIDFISVKESRQQIFASTKTMFNFNSPPKRTTQFFVAPPLKVIKLS